MKLKMKLTSTVAAFFLILALVVMGVFALPTVNIALKGKLSFTATNVHATVKGSVEGYANETDPQLPDLTYKAEYEGTEEQDLKTAEEKWKDCDLAFDSNGSPITITITIINNATDRPIYASVNKDITATFNNVDATMYKVDSAEATPAETNKYTGSVFTIESKVDSNINVAYIKIVLEVEDKNTSLKDADYGFNIDLQDQSFAKDPDNVEETVTSEELAYDVDTETMTASVKMTDKTSGDVVVPMFVKDGANVYTVTGLSENAFKDNTSITSITLPDTIETIGKNALSGVPNTIYTEYENGYYLGNETNPHMVLITAISKDVTTFTIHEDCKVLGSFCFSYSTFSNISIPESVKIIDVQAFAYSSLSEVDIPDSVVSVGSYSFANCSNLTSVIFPQSLETIGNAVFNSCSTLKDVSLPKTLNSMGQAVFQLCTSLTEVILPENLTEISGYTFNQCKSLINVVFPNTITKIGRTAFQRCENLTSEIVIPPTVTRIEPFTFTGCKKIEKITLHDNINYIGDAAFNECSSAEINKIPGSVTQIGRTAFQSCYKLWDASLPNGLEYIGDYALNHCYGATNTTITIPSSIKQIGGRTYDADNPDLNVIGSHVFYDCATNSLNEFVMEGENENFTVVDGVLYRKDSEGNPSVLVAYPPAKRDEKYVMPNTVVGAFELSLSRPYYLRQIVLSDNFIIKEYDNNLDSIANGDWTNSFSGMIYLYTGVTSVICNDTNVKYKSINGQVYSKDGTILYFAPLLAGHKSQTELTTLSIAEGCTTISFGSGVGVGNKYYTGNYAPANNLDEANHLDIYDCLKIPASVTTIDQEMLAIINSVLWKSIEVDEGNEHFEVQTTTEGETTIYTLVAKTPA